MAQRATIENFSQAAQIVKELGLTSCDGWYVDEWKEEGLKAFRRAIEDTMVSENFTVQGFRCPTGISFSEKFNKINWLQKVKLWHEICIIKRAAARSVLAWTINTRTAKR